MANNVTKTAIKMCGAISHRPVGGIDEKDGLANMLRLNNLKLEHLRMASATVSSYQISNETNCKITPIYLVRI